MREGRLSEDLDAVEKPPGTVPGRLAEDGRAEREAQAEAASQSSPRLFPAPIPGRGAAKCRVALQLAGRRGRGPPGDASLWNPGRAGSKLPEVWAGTPEAWQRAVLISTLLD